jgi:hypothetical protein
VCRRFWKRSDEDRVSSMWSSIGGSRVADRRFGGGGGPPPDGRTGSERGTPDEGETSLAKLVLLCRPHHRVIHRGFGVEIVDGRPVSSRLDGRRSGDRAPPPT